jgi:hypothetical protein
LILILVGIYPNGGESPSDFLDLFSSALMGRSPELAQHMVRSELAGRVGVTAGWTGGTAGRRAALAELGVGFGLWDQ